MSNENPLAKMKETARQLARELNETSAALSAMRERVFGVRAVVEQAIPHVEFARDMLIEAYGEDSEAWSETEKDEIAKINNLLENMRGVLTDKAPATHDAMSDHEDPAPILLIS